MILKEFEGLPDGRGEWAALNSKTTKPHQSAQKEHENHGDEGDVVAAGQLYQIPKDDGGQEGAGLRGGVYGAGDGTSVAGSDINADHEGRWLYKRNPKLSKREED